MALICQLPFELQTTVIRSGQVSKSLRLYAIYLEMRKTLFQNGQKADIIAAKWIASEERQEANTKSKMKAFASSTIYLKSKRMSCLPVKDGLLEEATMLTDLLQALVAALTRLARDDADAKDELVQHTMSILENDLFYLTQAVVEAAVSVLCTYHGAKGLEVDH